MVTVKIPKGQGHANVIQLPIELKYNLSNPKTKGVVDGSRLMYMGIFQARLIRKLKGNSSRYVTYAKLTDFDSILYLSCYTEMSLAGYKSLSGTMAHFFVKTTEELEALNDFQS